MKRTILLSIFMIFLFLSVYSQDDIQGIYYGLEIQPQLIIQLAHEDPQDLFESSYGFGAAISAQVFYQPRQSYRIGVGLSFQQYRLEYNDYSILLGNDILEAESDRRNSWFANQLQLNYLGISLLNQFDLKKQDKHRLYVLLGGDILTYFSKNIESTLYQNGARVRLSSPIEKLNSPSSILILINLGIGYELLLANSSAIYFEPKIAYLLNRSMKGFELIEDENVNVKRGFLNIGLAFGYRF